MRLKIRTCNARIYIRIEMFEINSKVRVVCGMVGHIVFLRPTMIKDAGCKVV